MKKFIPIILLTIALIAGGIMMMSPGKDAVTIAYAQKSALLAADTVNVSFQGVGGKVVSVLVAEEQQVKQGDILMILDATDLDLQINKLELDIQQQDIRIRQAQAQVSHTEDIRRQAQFSHAEDIDSQLLIIEAAQNAVELAQINYERVKSLFDAGVAAQADLDAVNYQLETAANNLSLQQTALEKIKANLIKVDTSNVYSVDSFRKQKESMEIQLQALEEQKNRMILKAPADGKIIRVVPKNGENIPMGTIAAVIESNQLYFDIYVDEMQVSQYKTSAIVLCHVLALQKDVEGIVSYITSAPPYAGMRMSRDKGQSDVSSFRVRINVERTAELLPGMTVEVTGNGNVIYR